MGNYFERCFFRFYPSKQKKTDTEEGVWMRRTMMLTFLAHFSLAVFTLACVGFWEMFTNVIMSCWAYSAYLTMREKAIILYMVLLVGQITFNACSITGIGQTEAEKVE